MRLEVELDLLIMGAELLALDRVSPGAALSDDPVANSC